MTTQNSQIKGKQLQDFSINPNHVTNQTKHDIINTKKEGIARIVPQIQVTTGTGEIEITEQVYAHAYNSQFTTSGFKNGVRTTGIDNPVEALDEKGRGFANYKVWLRNTSNHFAINNGVSNSNVFAELYVKEFVDVNLGYEYSQSVVSSLQNEVDVQLSNVEPSEYFPTNYVGGILNIWNNNNDEADKDIGYIISQSGTGRIRNLVLSEPSPVTHSGAYKVVRYFLKFYTHNTAGDIVEFSFTTDKTIDLLFVESLDSIYEEPINQYNYNNFFQIVDQPVPKLANYVEEQLFATNITEEGADDGNGRPYVDFQLAENYYDEGSMQVFLDGVKIQKFVDGDDPLALRFYETNAGEGRLRVVNFYSEDLDTEELFARYSIEGATPSQVVNNIFNLSVEELLESGLITEESGGALKINVDTIIDGQLFVQELTSTTGLALVPQSSNPLDFDDPFHAGKFKGLWIDSSDTSLHYFDGTEDNRISGGEMWEQHMPDSNPNGSEIRFVFQHIWKEDRILVYEEGVELITGEDVNVTLERGLKTVIFTTAPPNGSRIWARYEKEV